MADSPVYAAPVTPAEKPILEKLVLIRDKLVLLKEDKSTYVKSTDVIPLYNQVQEQVHNLNEARGSDHLVQNRVDSILDDCLQLLSLFFMAIGRNDEAPALYSTTSVIARLCDHLKECAFYIYKDLTGIENTLAKMRKNMGKDEEHEQYSVDMVQRITYRIEICEKMVAELRQYLSGLDEHMIPIWDKLVSILRAIAALNTRSKYSQKDLDELRDQVLAMQKGMQDGKLQDDQGKTSGGQELVVPLMERCLKFCVLVEQRKGKVQVQFMDTYKNLLEIRNHLERLTMTQAWSLRETDLWMWQRKLDRIDDARKDGNFFCSGGQPADLHTQRTLLYLIRKSYALIYQLLIASEPVSEALLPIYNQLTTLRKCLIEVKKNGGISSSRELYPYSMKLASIDNMRRDGKFVVGKGPNADVPEGQTAVIKLLEECYEIAHELKNSAEAEGSSIDSSKGDAGR